MQTELQILDKQIAELVARRNRLARETNVPVRAMPKSLPAHTAALAEVRDWQTRPLKDLKRRTTVEGVVYTTTDGVVKIRVQTNPHPHGDAFICTVRACGLGDLATASGRTARKTMQAALSRALDEVNRRIKLGS